MPSGGQGSGHVEASHPTRPSLRRTSLTAGYYRVFARPPARAQAPLVLQRNVSLCAAGLPTHRPENHGPRGEERAARAAPHGRDVHSDVIPARTEAIYRELM